MRSAPLASRDSPPVGVAVASDVFEANVAKPRLARAALYDDPATGDSLCLFDPFTIEGRAVGE